MISKVKLKELFIVLASFHEKSLENKVARKKLHIEEGRRFIDDNLLIELLTTVALSQKSVSEENQGDQYKAYFTKVRSYLLTTTDIVFDRESSLFRGSSQVPA